MQDSNVPVKFPIPWGYTATASYIRQIPVASQIGTTPGAASLTDGFPPLNSVPVSAGGIPPFQQDMNGILNQSTAWLRWMQAGGPIYYDAAFATSIGGYPKGAVLTSATLGQFWINQTENNTTNPDSGGTGWTTIQAQANTWTGIQTHTANILFNNNTFVYGKDTSGAQHPVIGYAADNFVHVWAGQNGIAFTSFAQTINPLILDNSGNGTFASGVASLSVDVGGANFRAIGGGYGWMIRNDGTSTYFLLTPSGTPKSSFNNLRPFTIANATGAVGLDGTGAGVTYGGTLSGPNIVASAGTVGGVGLPGAGAVNAANINATGAIAANGNVQSTGGRVRSGLGAFGSGDNNACVILGDFTSNLAGIGYERLPNGVIIQWGAFSNVPVDNTAHLYNVPIAFPNGFATVVVSTGAFAPQAGAMAGAQPQNNSQFNITISASPATGNLGIWFLAIGY